MWEGDLSPSTPVLSNTGTNRGLPVSCAGNEIADEVNSIAKAILEHEEKIISMFFAKGGIKGITEHQLQEFAKSRINVCLLSW